ncbi:MAG: hypothetical protein JXR63_02595 [Spirochaetales bacterium]|nr:hypothetical protein [Spirochaetales bacterium]
MKKVTTIFASIILAVACLNSAVSPQKAKVTSQIWFENDVEVSKDIEGEIRRSLEAAVQTLTGFLVISEDVTVKIAVKVSPDFPTSCRSAEFIRIGGERGGYIYEQLFASLIKDPAKYNQKPVHIRLFINSAMLEKFWFDPDPIKRDSPLPERGKIDAVTVLLHELLHALCINGWKDSETGESSSPNGAISTYDLNVTEKSGRLYFSGPKVSKLYPGGIPLTARNYKHYGQRGDDPDLSNLLMFGDGHHHPFRSFINQLDLAIIEDCGIKVKNGL